jgi:NDP-sugar pyrophosphorylase family protein
MDALILAAGLGTRLSPITDVLPKALVPVGDKAVAEHALAAVQRHAHTVVLNAHHHRKSVEAFCEKQGLLCSSETALLGTAGGLARARTTLGRNDDVLVYNADMWAPDIDLGPLLARFAASEAAQGALLYRPAGPGEGNIGVNPDGRVVRLRQERFGPERQGGFFLGIHVVAGTAVLPAMGCLVGDVYLPLLRAGATLVAEPYGGDVFDIGTPTALLDANVFWLRRRGIERWTAEGAQVHPDVRWSVVHDGANVRAKGTRLLVGPGAQVSEPLDDAVVFEGRVARG